MVRRKQPDVFGWSDEFTVSGSKVVPRQGSMVAHSPRFFSKVYIICTPYLGSLVQMTRILLFEHMYLH